MNLRPPARPESGFTLIEMVGVIAVIAFLVGLLTPRVLAAMENARLSQTVSSLKTVRAAALGYFGEYGRFGEARGGSLGASATNWANVLVAENLLDAPFQPRLGENARLEVITVPQGAVPGVGGCFDLSGTGATAIPPGSQVVVARLFGLSARDAWALSKRFDGSALSAPDCNVADTHGRVTYAADGGTVTVYLVHLPAAATAAGITGAAEDASISSSTLQAE